MGLSKIDTYILINKSLLNDSDRLVLSMLYEPIIGAIPLSLYFTLWSELKELEIVSTPFTHLSLQNIMGIKLDDIESSRKKLEAVGLLKTYKKDNNYVYVLYSPLQVSEFLNHPILATALLSSIGKVEYKKIIDMFKLPKINLNNYEDISVKFSDLYEMSMDIESNAGEIIAKDKLDLVIDEVVDFDFIINSMDNIISEKAFTKNIRNLINRLAYLYNFDSLTMSNLIKNSINEKGLIIESDLKKCCKNYYNFENDSSPKLIYKSRDKVEKKETNNMKEKLVEYFSTTSPYDFLVSKYNGAKPTMKDVNLIESLLADQELNPGVVNVLIDYVLRTNDNKLVSNYCMAIASQWKISNIKTVQQAMEHALKEHNKKYNIKKKDEEKLPSWYGKKITKKEMTNDEITELEDMLSEFK